jgi:hypothetical protein
MILRQGLFTMGRGKANLQGFKNAFQALKNEENWVAINESYFYKELPDGRLLEPIRSKAGLSTSDIYLDPEELTTIRLLKSIPGIGRFVGSLERAQSAFINTVRREVFDSYAAKFPDADPTELALRAKFVNNATGRSNFKEIPTAFQLMMTSPRYTASRWSMAGEAFRNPAMAMKSTAARENLKDLGFTASTIATSLGIMQALGFQVDWDYGSSDFLKARRGGVTYDPTAGMGKVMRTALRMVAYYLGRKEENFFENFKEEVGKIFEDTLSPAVSTGKILATGTTLAGKEPKEYEKGLWNLTPLVFSGFMEGLKADGLGIATADTAAEFLGIGVNRYPSSRVDALGRPWNPKLEQQDADVLSELKRIGLEINNADKRKGYTDAQNQDLATRQGTFLIPTIRAQMAMPGYQKLSRSEKKQLLINELKSVKREFNKDWNDAENERAVSEFEARVREELKRGLR